MDAASAASADKLSLDLSRVFASTHNEKPSPALHRGYTGKTQLAVPVDAVQTNVSTLTTLTGRSHFAIVPQQTVQLTLAVEGKNPHRPYSARVTQSKKTALIPHRPHSARLAVTQSTRPITVGSLTLPPNHVHDESKNEHREAEGNSPHPPAQRPQRPQTARPLTSGRRTITSARRDVTSRARPQTARESQAALIKDLKHDPASVIVPPSRKQFSSRPLSGVPVMQPNGVSSDLLKDLAPNHYVLSQASRQALEAKKTDKSGDMAFKKLKKAILRGEPLPTQEQPHREPSPVRWEVIEKERPLAACEKKILQRQVHAQVQQENQPASQQDHKRSSALFLRPASLKGKFHQLGPPKNQLRTQVTELQVASTAEAEGRTLLRDRPTTNQQRADDDKDLDTSVHDQMIQILQKEDCRTFLTQTTLHSIPTAREEPTIQVHKKNTMFDYLEPAALAYAVDRLPLACDGRLMVSAELKQVIAKRENHLLERVHQIFADRKQEQKEANQGHALRKNVVHSKAKPEEKRSRAAAAAAARAERAAEVSRRRTEAEKQKKEETIRKLEWRELGIKRQEEEDLRKANEGHLKMALVMMTVGRSMAVLSERMQQWQERKPAFERRRAAIHVISVSWKRYLLKKYAKARAEAMMRLMHKLRACVKRWRTRQKNRQANIIVDFLRQVGQAARFQLAVQQFRRKVAQAQKYVRRHLFISRARYELLELQWTKVDEERIQRFNEKREALLQSIKTQMDRNIGLKGTAKTQQLQRMKEIERCGGAKRLRECKLELEESRRHYCEYFLPPEMREVAMISANIKRRMLRHYVKKFRAKYSQDWELYQRQLELWTQLNQTKASLHEGWSVDSGFRRRASSTSSVSRAPPQSTSAMAPPGNTAPLPSAAAAAGETYQIAAPGAPPPPPPNALIVLPPHVMSQIVAKAVETTKELSRKVLHGMGGAFTSPNRTAKVV